VSVTAHRQQLPAVARKGRIDVPPESAQRRPVHWLLWRGHLCNRRRSQYAAPAVEQSLRKKRQIVGGGKYSRMTRHAAHPASRGIVHYSAQQVMILIFFGRSDSRLPRMRRKEPSLVHTERRKNMLRRIFIERIARKALCERSQHHEVDIAVMKRRPWGPVGRDLKRHAIRGVLALPLLHQVEIFRQPRVVHQQLPDRNLLLPVLPKLGKVLRHRIAHAKFPLLPKLHQGRSRRHHLRKRRTVKHRIERHRLPPRLNRAAAVSFAIDHLPVVPDDEDSARNLPLHDGVVDDGIENGETRIKRSLAESCCAPQKNERQNCRCEFHACCDCTRRPRQLSSIMTARGLCW